MHCYLLYEQAAADFWARACSSAIKNWLCSQTPARHIILRRTDPFAQTVVPDHRKIDRGTLRAILRQTDIEVDELVKLL